MPTAHLSTTRADLDEAVRILRAGGLVAVPTETVYGLAARGLDETSVRRIFTAKGRPQDNPVILHVASPADALPLWSFHDETEAARAQTLAQAFWPGPLTIVAHRSPVVPDVVTAGLAKVAVRVPAHDVCVAILRALGEPLAAPSANASSRPSPTSAADVLESLDGRIDAVVDGGACRHGIESTVIDVTGAVPRVLRSGATALSEIRAFLPDTVAGAVSGDASPGLRHRHYVPAGARVELAGDVAPHWRSGAGIVLRAKTAVALTAALGARGAPLEVLADDPPGYARTLYAALYRLERSGIAHIVIEDVPVDDAWAGVRDRIVRASS